MKRIILAHLVKLDEWLAGATMAGMLVLGIAAMLARGFGTSIIWSEELLRNALLWLTMLGAVAVTRRGEHIVVLLGSSDSRPTKLMLAWQTAIDGSCAIFCLIFAYYSAIYLYAFGSVKLITLPHLPLATFMIVVPIGLALMAVAFGARSVLLWIEFPKDERAS